MRNPVGHLRRLIVSVVATILATAGLAPAQTSGPDLSPPSEMPATSAPSPAVAPRQKAVLAVPGMIRSTPAQPSSTPEPPPPAEAPGALPLDAPAEMPAPARPRVNAAGRATVIESTPIEDGNAVESPASRPGTTRRTTVTSPKIVDAPTPPPAARRGRFFGLLPPPPVARTPAAAAARPAQVADDLTLVESPLQIRIEKQAREAIGDRARSIEVKMTGKKAVAIRATGVKFYQKRAVRKSIEALPALSGMRSTIEVLD